MRKKLIFGLVSVSSKLRPNIRDRGSVARIEKAWWGAETKSDIGNTGFRGMNVCGMIVGQEFFTRKGEEYGQVECSDSGSR